MVFMKKANKGIKPNQKGQNKKPFQKEADMGMSDDSDDMDFDDDSDDAIVTKTPKGKQSLNEKRVSFQMPGKNTPAKTPVGKNQATPAKGNSVSKKQPTPGKVGLQKFQGMEQQNQKSKKRSQPEDDDDDEDEDDDDDEEEDDSDFGPDMDLIGGDDDDDEDDEDDDDEDDDDEDMEGDDDDDDEEDENTLKGKNQKLKAVQNKQTPMKGDNKQTPAKTPKGLQTPKSGQTPSPKKENSAVSPKMTAAVAPDEKRKRERDAKQLYLGKLPLETAVEEIKSLSSDIVSVIMPNKSRGKSHLYAFLQFASEEKAEENFKKLKAKTFKGAPLNLDYVGFKSSHQPSNADQGAVNPKKLYVAGLPLDVTVLQIAKFFPTCHTVSLNQSSSYRTAMASFWTKEESEAAFEKNKVIEIKGVKAPVLFSRDANKISRGKKNRQRKNKNGHLAKKMKTEE